MDVSTYKAPRSVRESQQREPSEARYWMEAIKGELDWFFENGKVTVMNKYDKGSSIRYSSLQME
jgi:hypothetical protein